MPERQPRLAGVPRNLTPERERRRLERQIKALETLKARGWWRAVAIEAGVIAIGTVAVYALLGSMRAFEGMPWVRVFAALLAGVLIGMTLRRPWQTARLVVCGLAILVIGFVLAALLEGNVPAVDVPIDGGGGEEDNEETSGQRRINDALEQRRRRLTELAP